jgi:NAD(P)-dependent dehydrogenase (short-subunit alcohol dehydrogenase family)
MFSLKGKVAVVTGAAGLLGRQITRALAEAGATTFVAGRSLDRLETEAAAWREQGAQVHAMAFDQSHEDSIQALLDQVVGQAHTVDVLVNNAVERPMRDWSSPPGDFARSMAVNATGLFQILRCFGDAMAARGCGSIINIGSIQGIVGPDFTLYEGLDWGTPPDYFFHKGGMVSLTRYAAATLGRRGVRVNCLSPGGLANRQDPVFVKRYCARTFLGRMAGPTDLLGAVVFLASDASAYVTGVNLVVDGGYTAK